MRWFSRGGEAEQGGATNSSLALRKGGLEAYVADLRVLYTTPVATFFLFKAALRYRKTSPSKLPFNPRG